MKEFYLKETRKPGLYKLHVDGVKQLHRDGADVWTMAEVLAWLDAKHKADSREVSDR